MIREEKDSAQLTMLLKVDFSETPWTQLSGRAVLTWDTRRVIVRLY